MGNLVKTDGNSLVGLLHGKGGELAVPKPYERDIFLFDTYVAGTSHLEDVNEIESKMDFSTLAKTNLPPRLRMSTVYAVSQCVNGRVVNTCNLSEDWVGYSTRYGDAAGDFSPLSNLTVTEIKQIGKLIGLPTNLVDKVPIDGLCGKTDEDNLGFTYAELDVYIRTGKIENKETKKRIDTLHERNLFKLQLMPCFPYKPE